MGRLSGFKYRRIVGILKRFNFEFFGKQPVAMKFGIVNEQIDIQPYPITQAICLKER